MEKKGVNRRNFLRISATASAGALLIPGATASTLNKSATPPKTEFPTRTLGRTGIKLPLLSMGVMRADNPNIVRAAYNAGIIHFDTAHGYEQGRNEEMLGNFFKDKPRDSFYIATKCKTTWPLSDTFEKDYAAMFDLSLKRLQMDHIDWFYVHDLKDPDQVKNERLLNVIKKFKSDGKTKYLALSMHANNPAVIDAAVEAGVYDIILLSYNFKLDNLNELNEAIARGAKAGIGFIAMKTMTGGTEDAEGKKKVNGQACLRWAWSNENITTAIPGFTSYDLLDDCIAAVENHKLTESDKNYLASLCTGEGLYCQQCGICIDQCPEHLPIPDMMRAYMYAYGYKHAQLSKETLTELSLPKEVCSNCEECKVKCHSGFNVGEKIAAIAPIRDTPMEFLT